MAKADKMVGGAKVKVPRVEWSVMVRGPRGIDGEDDGTQITLQGEASDAVQAAILASSARQSIMDARNADKAIKDVGGEGEGDAADETQAGKAQSSGRR